MRIVQSMGRVVLPTLVTVLAIAGASAPAAALPTAPVSALLQAAAQSDPVAMVVRVTGDVRVQRGGGGAASAATVGMRLMAGDRVNVPTSAQVILLYVSGRRETVTQTTTIAPPAQAQRAGVFDRTVSTLNAVASTDARQQPNRQGMIRPIAGAATLMSPRNEIKVVDLRPTFTWSPVANATGYTIQIRSDDGVTRKRFNVGQDTSWTLPSSEPPLSPGVGYHWTVAPAGGGRVAEEQVFRTLDAEEYAAVAEGMAELRSAELDPWTDGLFLAALVYRDAGLFYEADRALSQLETGDASLGPAYYLLRGEVYDALGLLELAAASFDRAADTD